MVGIVDVAMSCIVATQLSGIAGFTVAGKTIRLVVDPHACTVLGVENESGEHLGSATALDSLANLKRVRRKPVPVGDVPGKQRAATNLVELTYQQYHGIKEA